MVRGKQQPVLISSQCMVTTVTRIYRHHGAENSSRHFVPHLEHAQAPPPLSQPIKTMCPAEPTVYMGIFIFPEYMHSTAIYKHRLAMAGPQFHRPPGETSSACVCVCKVPAHGFSEHRQTSGDGQRRHLLVKGRTEVNSTGAGQGQLCREHAGSGVGLTLARHPSWKGAPVLPSLCTSPSTAPPAVT